MTSMFKGAIGATALSLMAIGCNQSNPELDSTKQQLQSVTAERDTLKTQVDTANQNSAAQQQQIDQLKHAVAAPAAAAAAEPTTAQNEKLSHPPKQEHTAAATEAKKEEIKQHHRAM